MRDDENKFPVGASEDIAMRLFIKSVLVRIILIVRMLEELWQVRTLDEFYIASEREELQSL